jgi:uncharacterized delta-60 repeat protein
MVQSEPYQEGTDNVSIPRQRPVWIAVGVCTLMALGCAVWFLVAHTMASKPVPRIALDTTFNPGTNAEREIRTAFVQPDKKILIGGTFTGFGDGSSRGLARLRADGSVDPVFAVTVTGDVHALALQPDGKIIIAGGFGKVNGQSRRNIARLDADGTLDGGFSPDAAVNREIRAVAIQPDGKILVAGNFDAMSGRRQNRIARLNADGTRDTSFRIGAGAPAMVWSLALQPDGKIIATGDFATFNNKRFARLVRLNENGSLDSTFNPGSGADGAVLAVALQKDGKILLGGDFTHVNDVERNRIARLNPDGSADATFNPGAGPNTGVRCVSVQPDGRILMGGVFTSVQGIARNRLARLNPDGILDTSFDPGEGASDVIRWVTVEPDGKILIAGGFKKFAGADRALIARLSGDSK